MIHEIASITIDPADAAAFEAAVETALPLFLAADGCLSIRLERQIEHAGGYLLIVGWRSVEDHTVNFRQSAAFAEWRALVGCYFFSPPEVSHVERCLVAGLVA